MSGMSGINSTQTLAGCPSLGEEEFVAEAIGIAAPGIVVGIATDLGLAVQLLVNAESATEQECVLLRPAEPHGWMSTIEEIKNFCWWKSKTGVTFLRRTGRLWCLRLKW
jgi:hypothetical protein